MSYQVKYSASHEENRFLTETSLTLQTVACTNQD